MSKARRSQWAMAGLALAGCSGGHAGDTPAITAPIEVAPQPVASAGADEQGTLARVAPTSSAAVADQTPAPSTLRPCARSRMGCMGEERENAQRVKRVSGVTP